MSRLLDLPTEMLNRIFSHLPVWKAEDGPHAAFVKKNKENSRALIALSLTCKRIHMVVEPFLYRTFVKPKSSDDGVTNETLRSFLRTLLMRRGLGCHVKTLVLGWWDGRHGKQKDKSSSLTLQSEIERRRLYLEAAERIDLGERKSDWIKHLHTGSEDAEIALLLLLTPAVEHLAMTVPEYDPSNQWMLGHPYYRTVLQMATQRQYISETPHFERLQRFTSMESPEEGFHIDNLSEIFKLESIKAINGSIDLRGILTEEASSAWDAAAAAKERKWLWQFPPSSSSVRIIDVVNFDCRFYDQRMTADSIAACKDLESFKFTYKPEGNFCPDFRWELLGNEIRLHENTLEVLKLDVRKSEYRIKHPIDWHEQFSESVENFWTIVGPLRDMKLLRQLYLHESLILPHPRDIDESRAYLLEIMPSSLEELTITGFTDRMCRHLELMVEVLPSRFPLLGKIRLRFEEGLSGIEEQQRIMDHIDGVTKGCTAVSVVWFKSNPLPIPAFAKASGWWAF